MGLKFTGEFCVMTMKNDAKLEDEFEKFWPEHSKISNICTLKGCFWPKYIMLELKKYRGVIFDGTEDWCKIWRRTDLCFLKVFVYRLKNCDFILESKMAELNWEQNLLIYFENCRDVPYSHEYEKVDEHFANG